jgi:hypothetical protein
MGGPAHRSGRIDRNDLVVDQPIEQMTNSGQLLLGGGRLVAARPFRWAGQADPSIHCIHLPPWFFGLQPR